MTPVTSQYSSPDRLYEAYVFDLDGTIYLGNELIDGAREVVEALRAAGKRTLFLSNNPTRNPGMYAVKLTALGIPTPVEDIVNPLVTLPVWLRRNAPEARLFVIGEEPLVQALEESGFALTDRADEIDIVVASFDRGFTYSKLQTAFDALWQHRRARLVTTNPDPYCPLPGGRGEPDAGAIVAAIEACTGVACEVNLGKPGTPMIDAIMDLVGVVANDCIVIGDRVLTDIAMAKAAGVDSAVVFSGEATYELVTQLPDDKRPTYLLPSIRALVQNGDARHGSTDGARKTVVRGEEIV